MIIVNLSVVVDFMLGVCMHAMQDVEHLPGQRHLNHICRSKQQQLLQICPAPALEVAQQLLAATAHLLPTCVPCSKSSSRSSSTSSSSTGGNQTSQTMWLLVSKVLGQTCQAAFPALRMSSALVWLSSRRMGTTGAIRQTVQTALESLQQAAAAVAATGHGAACSKVRQKQQLSLARRVLKQHRWGERWAGWRCIAGACAYLD